MTEKNVPSSPLGRKELFHKIIYSLKTANKDAITVTYGRIKPLHKRFYEKIEYQILWKLASDSADELSVSQRLVNYQLTHFLCCSWQLNYY